jgi:hypothetical protein
MSKKKAQQPGRAKNRPALSSIRVVKVTFGFFRKYDGEIVLELPKKTSKADFAEILDVIATEHRFDDFVRHDEYSDRDTLSIRGCKPAEGDKADFVATRNEDGWNVKKTAAH